MKPKNMILVAVAVVCGLVAAFLTSQMSAKTKKIDTVRVPVANAEITIGTKIKEEEFDKYVKWIDMPREAAPQLYVDNPEQLKNKWVTRTMRPNDPFNPADVSLSFALNPPPKHSAMTVRIQLDEGVAGFVKPGADVDVIASVTTKKSQKAIIFPLFTKIKVLAVDANFAPPPGGQMGYANLSMVTFAVNKETSLLLQAANTRGAQLRLALRHQDEPVKYDELTSEQIWDILSDRIDEKNDLAKQAEQLKLDLVKVKVPTEDLKSGTTITEELLAEKFTEVEFPKDRIPQNTVRDWDRHIDKGDVLLKDVAASHFVPKTFVGKKPDEATPEPMVEPTEVPKPLPPKLDYHDVIVTTPKGIFRHRYLVMPNGEYKYLGAIDGSTAEHDLDGTKDNLGEKKPAAKADQPKSEPKTEPKAEVKPKPKAQPQPEPKKEPEPEAKIAPLA